MSGYEVVESRSVFHGGFIEVLTDRIRLPSGEIASREVVRHPGAAAVVGIRDERVVLVRQYRHPLGQDLLEIPAGKLDGAEETPAECAAREFHEETGFQARELKPLGRIHTSPGFADEVIHLFLAEPVAAGEGQSMGESSGELSEVVWVGLAEALRMIDAGTITDAKTVAGLLLAARGSGTVSPGG